VLEYNHNTIFENDDGNKNLCGVGGPNNVLYSNMGIDTKVYNDLQNANSGLGA
jgi:hypothetical protein